MNNTLKDRIKMDVSGMHFFGANYEMLKDIVNNFLNLDKDSIEYKLYIEVIEENKEKLKKSVFDLNLERLKDVK